MKEDVYDDLGSDKSRAQSGEPHFNSMVEQAGLSRLSPKAPTETPNLDRVRYSDHKSSTERLAPSRCSHHHFRCSGRVDTCPVKLKWLGMRNLLCVPVVSEVWCFIHLPVDILHHRDGEADYRFPVEKTVDQCTCCHRTCLVGHTPTPMRRFHQIPCELSLFGHGRLEELDLPRFLPLDPACCKYPVLQFDLTQSDMRANRACLTPDKHFGPFLTPGKDMV